MINYFVQGNMPYEIDEITVSAAIYKGKESVSLRETAGR